MGASLPPGLTRVQFQQIPRLGFLRSQRLNAAHYWGTWAGAFTIHQNIGLEGDFDAVRLIFSNDSATPFTIDKVAIAATATENAAGGFMPLDAGGGALPWTVVTTNGAGADGLPPSASGAAVTLAIPAATVTTEQPAIAYTDWMRLSSTPLSDTADPKRILMVRAYSLNGGRCFQDATRIAAWADTAVNRGRILSSAHKTTDYATNRVAMTGTSSSGFMPVYGVQYYTRAIGATILAVGDSLTQGIATTSDMAPWGFLASTALSRAGRPVSFSNGGIGGQSSVNYHARARQEIDAFRPDVFVFPAFTPNDGPTALTQAIVDTAWSRALDIAHYARTKGATPVFLSPMPWVSYDATSDAFRMQIVQRCRDMAANGSILLIDAESVVSDGATPARIKSIYDSGDGKHPNDAGHAAIAALARVVFAKAIGA